MSGAFAGDEAIFASIKLVSDAGDVKTASDLRSSQWAPSVLADFKAGRPLP